MEEILPSLRTLLIDHLATASTLTADMLTGTDEVKVSSTSRFRAGDEIFIMSVPLNKSWPTRVLEVMDFETLKLFSPTLRDWTTTDLSFVQKAISHSPLKRVYIGDFRRSPDFPYITLSPNSENNDWWALGATEHEYRVSIRIYIESDNFESSELLLSKYAKATREILIDHIHPIINESSQIFPLTIDLPQTGTIVTVADTSVFQVGEIVIIRDADPPPSHQEFNIRTILTPTEMELSLPAKYDFETSKNAEIIRLNRFLYDTRPSEINYGFVPGSGASLLRAAEINWYGKEVRCRLGNILT